MHSFYYNLNLPIGEDVEHPFMCSLAVYVSSLMKYLFTSLAIFILGCFLIIEF